MGLLRGVQIATGSNGIATANLQDGILSADASGRAKMASSFFDNTTTVADKFAAASIGLDRLEESVIQADGGQAFTADQSMGSNKLTNLADGTANGDAVNLGQLNAVNAGLDPKGSARVATTGLLSTHGTTPAYSSTGGTSTRGQITWATGPTTIDGVTLANDDRILVKDEGTGTAEVHSVDTVADSAGSLNNTYWIFYVSPNKAYYVWYNVSAGGTDPAPSAPAGVGYTGIEVAIATNDTANTVASATDSAINAVSGIEASSSVSTNALTITNSFGGSVTDVADTGSTGFTVGTDTQGTGLGSEVNAIWVRTSANTWDRATDFDSDTEVTAGAFLPVTEGTAGGDQLYLLTTNDPIQIGGAGGSSLTWATFGSLSITLGGTPSTIEPDDAANEGASSNAARADHTHAIVTVAPSVEVLTDASTFNEGTATSFLRSDARFILDTATPGTSIQSDAAGASLGSATTALRSDAGLIAATAAPSDVGSANAQGSSTSLARADHVHDIGHEMSLVDKEEAPTATSGDQSTTGITLAATPVGWVTVLVNGIAYEVVGATTGGAAYFSNDGGSTARALGAAVSGDQLIWNGSTVGFDLVTTDDVSMNYLRVAA